MKVIDLIALSCAIYRINQQSCFNTNDTFITTNKAIILKHLFPHQQGDSFTPVSVSDEDRELSSKIINHFKKLSFKLIGDSLSPFQSKIYQLSQTSECSVSDIGVIAYIPMVYFEDLKKLNLKTLINDTSKEYIGVEGQQVSLKCQLIEVRHVESISCYSHTAITQSQDLLSWLHKKQAGFVNDWIKIKGRVKEHGEHFQFKLPETKLNYVKYF